MRFDVIVGNPPFQDTKDDGSRKAISMNLWSKFWPLVLSLAKKKGIACLITPATWASPSSNLKGEYKYKGLSRLWDVFNIYSSYANINDVEKHFTTVRSTFGYVIVDKSGDDGLRFSDGSPTNLGFMPLSGHDQVFKELSLNDNLNSMFEVDTKNHKGIRVSIPTTRYLWPFHIEVLDEDNNPVMGSKDIRNYVYVYTPDMDTAEYVKDRLISCIDIMKHHCRYSGFLSPGIVKLIKYHT
jgi:hypothetical protein